MVPFAKTGGTALGRVWRIGTALTETVSAIQPSTTERGGVYFKLWFQRLDL